jgi:DNA-binding NtrC family response regulator
LKRNAEPTAAANPAGLCGRPLLIGESSAFVQVLELIERIARVDAPALIQGETGTGKELAARSIHYLSRRSAGPFVPVNCGAIPEGLFEAELFGCERGAFTDAREARAGLIAAAEGGTLFLDELDCLSARAQVALLRFLQDTRFRPVGASRERAGNVRVVAASSPRLRSLLDVGAFRDDLVFRLDVLRLTMPPLREREHDVELLAEHFISSCACRHGLVPRRLDQRSRNWLFAHPWPGNVRELDNEIQRACLLSEGDCLRLGAEVAADLPTRHPALDPMQPFETARRAAVEQFELGYLRTLMCKANGNVTRAARLAGKERRCLGKLLKKHAFDRGKVSPAVVGRPEDRGGSFD